jgi:muramoyltetrapeptide carboxypeptidase
MRVPEPLRAGDRVAVVAPSSPFPRAQTLGGLAWLAQRYRVSFHSSLFGRNGYLAGDDSWRAHDLSSAMCDPEVRAIFAARGGYGATRIVSRLPWEQFAKAPKWIVGFSDITALHCAAIARGVACLHACNVGGFGARFPGAVAARASLMASLERPNEPHAWHAWSGLIDVNRRGDARGILFGGNLALLCAMAAAKQLVVPDGAIVLIEDVTERPYRIDRMLTSLFEGGYFARASAFVFGDFSQCDPGPDGVTVADVIRICLAHHFSVPVYMGAPFGHGDRNQAFPLGVFATIENGVLRWF